jgi:sec-independent protein translocase protein TatB
MFNIGLGELVLIFLVAFLVVGPKDLPRIARWLGRSVRKARNIYRTVIRTLELEDAAHEAGEAKAALQDAQKELSEALNEPLKAVKSLEKDISTHGGSEKI